MPCTPLSRFSLYHLPIRHRRRMSHVCPSDPAPPRLAGSPSSPADADNPVDPCRLRLTAQSFPTALNPLLAPYPPASFVFGQQDGGPGCGLGLTVAGPGCVWSNVTLDSRLHAEVRVTASFAPHGARPGDGDLLICGLSSNCQHWGQTPHPDALTVAVVQRDGRPYLWIRSAMFHDQLAYVALEHPGGAAGSGEVAAVGGALSFVVHFARRTIEVTEAFGCRIVPAFQNFGDDAASGGGGQRPFTVRLPATMPTTNLRFGAIGFGREGTPLRYDSIELGVRPQPGATLATLIDVDHEVTMHRNQTGFFELLGV